MNIFDLHCDTITECCNNNYSLYKNNLHFSLEKTAGYDSYTQVFAVWILDEYRGVEARDYFNKVADYYYSELQKNKDIISVYGDNRKTPVKGILAVEGGSACGGTLEGLEEMYNRGVRLVTLTWNGNNEIAAGALSEGGFTDFGKAFVKKAEEYGIILDVSHLNKQSFWEFCEFATNPFIASHSNGDIVNNPYAEKRNLTEEQIKKIKSVKGLIGLNFYRTFIETQEAQGIEALARQIDYFLSLGCEDVIALGSDFDGCKIHDDLNRVDKLKNVYNVLHKKGFSEDLLNKIFYDNAQRFFEENINNKGQCSEH